jgi:hypothetical protein
MIFHPTVIALFISSVLISFMMLYAGFYGIQILRRWDVQSGSELQLALERKTYLISTILTYVFSFELLSLFLFVYTADQLHTSFVGAMCAAGSLHVDSYGYPALIARVVNFVLAGLWLILNYADNKAYDYPLIKEKYSFLLLLAVLILGETILQANYFLRLRPDIITSCCGTLFSKEGSGGILKVGNLPSLTMKAVFYLTMAVAGTSGLRYCLRGKGAYLFSSLSVCTFLISMFSIFSFISLYFYELPTHACPFCFLQKEYGYIGYPIYLTLLGATISGMGVGMLMPFRNKETLAGVIPGLQNKLALVAVILFFIFTAMVTLRMVFSNLVLE